MKNIEYSLINDGFCILPKIFSSKIIELAKEGLWDVIQGDYETGVPPENRFWNKGDDPKKIIKIDKPHLCNNNIRRLITNFDFGQYLGQISDARTIQIWHSQLIWKPQLICQEHRAGELSDTHGVLLALLIPTI